MRGDSAALFFNHHSEFMGQPDISGILAQACDRITGAYRKTDFPELRGMIFRGWNIKEQDIRAIIAGMDTAPETERCKSGHKVTAVFSGGLFVKRYNMHGFYNRFRKIFQLPRPERVLAAALRLKESGIPCPAVLGAFRQSRAGIPTADYLITEKLDAGQLFCDKNIMVFSGGYGYRRFVDGTVSLLTKIHASGVEHGDLSLRNIFCRSNPDGTYSDWGVIDLDGCRIHSGTVPEGGRRRELARLISSFLRCLKQTAPAEPVSINAITGDFTRRYHELSGYDLSGSTLDNRVRMLTERIRRHRR